MMPIRVSGQGIGVLVFLSRSPNVYTQADVIVARRIVDHVALALSHDRLAEEAQRVAEAVKQAAAKRDQLAQAATQAELV